MISSCRFFSRGASTGVVELFHELQKHTTHSKTTKMGTPRTVDMFNLLSHSKFCEPVPDEPSAVTGFVYFHGFSLVVLVMVFCASMVHPFASSKCKSCLSYCDIRLNWRWKRGSKKGWNGEVVDELVAQEPKSVAGSVISFFMFWILYGIVFYVTYYMISTKHLTVTGSQDSMFIQNNEHNEFNLAAIVLYRLSLGAGSAACNDSIASSFTVTGRSVVSTSSIRTKYEPSYTRDFCFVWIETLIDGKKLPSSVHVNMTQMPPNPLYTDAMFGLLSVPRTRRVNLYDVGKPVVKYLSSRANYCSYFDSTTVTKTSIYSEPKSFQQLSSSSTKSSSLAFINLLQFSPEEEILQSDKNSTQAALLREGTGNLNVQVNFYNQKAYILKLQPIWLTLLVVVLIIAVGILLLPGIRFVTFLLISKYQRSMIWRVSILNALFVYALLIYYLLGRGVKLSGFFKEPFYESIILTAAIHVVFYWVVLLLNMIIYHKVYTEHEKALKCSSMDGYDELNDLTDGTTLPVLITDEEEEVNLLVNSVSEPVPVIYTEQQQQPQDAIYPQVA